MSQASNMLWICVNGGLAWFNKVSPLLVLQIVDPLYAFNKE
ncbi:hypothetical protein LDG_6157 [Legionella drancourtii LLAP12]|uniref:Uncharacterized protein n=1 Tax=Legionella drancourtii LLAP12 TaxID=658187 RepID=G9EL98_9GAMM|nr:hypothetical protein LDG_6157 [Legionella drancourtii LLAP12]